MSELKCNCGRTTHKWLDCGPDLPKTPRDWSDELTRLRAENAAIRAALKPILERIEMPRNGCSHTQHAWVQASELEALASALNGEGEAPNAS